MTLEEQYRDPRWKELAHRIKHHRDGGMCQHCGSTHRLQAHHKKYNKDGNLWDVPDEWLETLCKDCHDKRHNIETQIRLLPLRQLENVYGHWVQWFMGELQRQYDERQKQRKEPKVIDHYDPELCPF